MEREDDDVRDNLDREARKHDSGEGLREARPVSFLVGREAAAGSNLIGILVKNLGVGAEFKEEAVDESAVAWSTLK